jgi:hypothetical protein
MVAAVLNWGFVVAPNVFGGEAEADRRTWAMGYREEQSW